MYTHIGMPFDFRLSAWPYGGDRYVTTYNTDRYQIDIRMICDYVEEQLRKSPLAFVLKTTFTLVNLYSGFTDTSVGLVMEPAKKVRRDQIVFTFTRTTIDESGDPMFMHWLNNYTIQWGTSTTRSSGYITIAIPINIATRARLQQMTDREQKAMYDIVGGYTKAVIRSIHEYDGSVLSTRNFLRYTIPRAMFYMAISDWQYVLDFWKRMPDLIHVNWTPKFIEYYVRYIAPELPDRKRSKYYAQYEEEVQEHLRQFVLRYLQNTVQKDEVNLVALLPADDAMIHDVETLVLNLSKGIIA